MSNNRIQAGVKCLDLIGLLLLIPITINFAEGQSTQIGLHFHSPTPAWIVKCTMSGIGVLITSRFIDLGIIGWLTYLASTTVRYASRDRKVDD